MTSTDLWRGRKVSHVPLKMPECKLVAQASSSDNVLTFLMVSCGVFLDLSDPCILLV